MDPAWLDSMCGNGFAEFFEHYRSGDAVVCGDGDGVAGVIVDPVEDFDVGAVGEPPVRAVGLPAFVGLFGGEADVGGLRSFLRLWIDEAGCAQVVVDGVDRHDDAVVVAQVPGDGMCAVVEAFAGKLLTQVDDQVDRGLWECATGVTDMGDRRQEWCVHHYQQGCPQAFRRLVVF